MRREAIIIAPAAVLTMGTQYAAAQMETPPPTVHLSCVGTEDVSDQSGAPHPNSGLPFIDAVIINVTDGTVSWGRSWVAHLTGVTENHYTFGGDFPDPNPGVMGDLSGRGTVSVSGNIDRETGLYRARKTLVSGDKKETTEYNFEGGCKVASLI